MQEAFNYVIFPIESVGSQGGGNSVDNVFFFFSSFTLVGGVAPDVVNDCMRGYVFIKILLQGAISPLTVMSVVWVI